MDFSIPPPAPPPPPFVFEPDVTVSQATQEWWGGGSHRGPSVGGSVESDAVKAAGEIADAALRDLQAITTRNDIVIGIGTAADVASLFGPGGPLKEAGKALLGVLAKKATAKVAASTVPRCSAQCVGKLPDSANVVRGGKNLPSDLARGTGTHPSGVTGVSVEIAPGLSVEDLARNIPHSQIGTTTVGAVRSAGGDVITTSGRSVNHATMTGVSPAQASDLLRPTIPNPSRR